MGQLKLTTDPAVAAVFARYPEAVRAKMDALRALVIETAEAAPQITQLHETLKWGEPSFVTKTGSTLRMDWKAKTPNQYALYFQCSTRLVATFRLVFGNALRYEGKRAIVLDLAQPLPTETLQRCIMATLNYHKVKHLETLGL